MVILHTNDVQGRQAASSEAIGHDRIAALFAEMRRTTPATFLFDAGDAAQGTALVKWNKGEAAIDIMNAAGYDGMVLGNSDFDYGWDNALALADKAEFPIFTQSFVLRNAPGLQTAALFERGGRRLGVFGLTTPETVQASYGGFGRNFGTTEELFAYADANVQALRKAGAEVVVALTHLGKDDLGFLTSYQLRDNVQGIDVIIDGHNYSNTPLLDIVQVEGKALIVAAAEHAQSLGVVEFYSINGRLTPRARSIAREDAATASPAPSVTTVIDRWISESRARGARVVTRSPVRLNADRISLRSRETELGNLTTDAMRAATGADVALLNGGSIRDSLPQGDVTNAAIEGILPYDTTVIKAEVPGSILREALELGVSHYPNEAGGFLQASGISFSFDPAQPAGKRLLQVAVGGQPLNDARVYTVATGDWIASGGDDFVMLKAPFKTPLDGKTWTLIDILAEYLNQNGNKPIPGIEGRITIIGN